MPRKPISFWTAGRDNQRAIRMADGKGVLVANADAGRSDLEAALAAAPSDYLRTQYRSALELISREEASAADDRAARALALLVDFRAQLSHHERQEGAPVEYKNSRGAWDDVTTPINAAIRELQS